MFLRTADDHGISPQPSTLAVAHGCGLFNNMDRLVAWASSSPPHIVQERRGNILVPRSFVLRRPIFKQTN